MDWIKQVLGEGYTEELGGRIAERIARDYLPRTEGEAAREQAAALAGKLKEYEGVDVKALQSELAQLKERYQTETGQMQLDHALELALYKSGVHDPRTVLPLLDREAISLGEKGLEGLSDQLERVRKDAPYLFQGESSGAVVRSGLAHGNAPDADPITRFTRSARQGAGLTPKGEN